MKRPPLELEWPGTVSQTSGSSNRNRCVSQRLGAYCEEVSTGGPWCLEERRLHINCLELLAGSFAIKTFCKTKVVAHVKLLRDSISAVTYINKMGGGIQGSDRSHRLEIESSPVPVTGAEVEALGSRYVCISTHMTITTVRELETRPFGHSNRFVFNDWEKIKGYAFPPFAQIGRCLRQVLSQKVEQLVLVAPVWPAQSWYTVPLQLAVDQPLLFPIIPELLMKDNQTHPLTNLQLAGWLLSTSDTKQQVFRRKLEIFCWQHGEETLPVHTLLPGTNGLTGVVNDKLN